MNSIKNIAQFFSERGMPLPSGFIKQAAKTEPNASGGVAGNGSPMAPQSPAGPVTPAAKVPSGPSPAPRPIQGNLLSPEPQSGRRPRRFQECPRAPLRDRARSRANRWRDPGGIRAGTVITHPKYGRGTVLRREGDGDDAKLTISFLDTG